MKPRIVKREGAATIHEVADQSVPTLQRGWLEALSAALHAVQVAVILRALRSRIITQVLADLPWQAFQNAMASTFTPALTDVLRESWVRHETTTPNLTIGFGVRNVEAEVWALRHAATLAMDLSRESQQAIRQIIGSALERGQPIERTAREIRAVIGMTRLQARVYDRLVVDGASPQLLVGYRRRAIASRARTIARTESMRASNQGVQLLWHRAIEAGLLAPDQQRQWITTPDERLCPVCEPIPGRGPVGMREPFLGGNGLLYDAPPAHPSCRCALALVA